MMLYLVVHLLLLLPWVEASALVNNAAVAAATTGMPLTAAVHGVAAATLRSVYSESVTSAGLHTGTTNVSQVVFAPDTASALAEADENTFKPVTNQFIINDTLVQHHRRLLSKVFDEAWFNQVSAAKQVIKCNGNDESNDDDADPSEVGLSYKGPSSTYLAPTNVANSRRNRAKAGLCSVQEQDDGTVSFSPYNAKVVLHHVIPQEQLCDAINTWWWAAQRDKLHRAELMTCFARFLAAIDTGVIPGPGAAVLRMYRPDKNGGDWWGAGSTAALSYLTTAFIWNAGNTMPGPELSKRPTSMPGPPNSCAIDQSILKRFQDVGAVGEDFYTNLVDAHTSIKAMPSGRPTANLDPNAVPKCTTFFKHWEKIAVLPLEASAEKFAPLKPLNEFWRHACKVDSSYFGELPRRRSGPSSAGGKASAVAAATVSTAAAVMEPLSKAMAAKGSAKAAAAASSYASTEAETMQWANKVASRIMGRTATARPTPEAEIQRAKAMWNRQASSWEKLNLVPYQGPVKLLTHFNRNSPEVRRILRQAQQQAKQIVAQSEVLYNPARVAKQTVAVAVWASTAAAQGQVVSASAAAAALPEQFNITDISSRFAWDGNNAYGFELRVGGLVDQDTADMGWELLYDALSASLPWIDLQYLPLSNTALMDLAASYDFTSGTMTFTAFSGNYLWLLSLVRDSVKATFGVDLPAVDLSTSIRTSAVSLAVSRNGLQQLSVALDGSWSPSNMVQRLLGTSWPGADDLVVISSPSVVYTAIPLSLAISMQVDVPVLRVSEMVSSLTIISGGTVQLQLFGRFEPIPGLTITGMTLVSTNNSLQASASGVLAGVSMSVAGEIRSNGTGPSSKKTMMLVLSATNVNVGSILSQVFGSDGLVPEFLLEFLQAIRFQRITLTYNSAANGAKFGIIALPDIDGAPALKTVLNAVGLDPADVALRMGPSSLTFGITKSYILTLPAPFTQPGVVTWSLALDSQTKGVVLGGSFSSALAVPGVRDPVGIDVFAAISTSATNGVAIAFAGATTTPIVIQAFPFIQFLPFNMSASVSLQPTVLNQLTLAGGISMVGVTGSGLFTFDRSSGAIAMRAEISGINLQRLINSATGMNVNLGPLNVELEYSRISYSTVNLPSLNIPMGLFYNARFVLLTMRTDIAFALSADGVDFAVTFDTSEFSRVFHQQVLGRVDAALASADGAMKSAGSALMSSKAEAEAKVAQARDEVNATRKDVESKLAIFNQAKAQAEASVRSAIASLASATSAFEAAKSKAAADLAQARQNFNAADAAFNTARDRATTALNSAQNALNTAQRNYDNAMANANSQLNNAQANVNRISGDYNWHNSRCNRWPQNWGHCVAAGGLWTALQTANGVLNAARSAMNTVANGATRVALDAARGALRAAEAEVNRVLNGVEFASRQTANVALTAAQRVFDGVLTGVQAAAVTTAQGVLTAANAAQSAVLTGTHWVALNSANLAFDIATANLNAAEAAASATLSALSNALQAVGSAASSIKTANFLQLSSFSVAVRASKSRGNLYTFGYDISAGGTRFAGQLEFSSTEDLLQTVLRTLQGEVVKQLKAAFPLIAAYI